MRTFRHLVTAVALATVVAACSDPILVDPGDPPVATSVPAPDGDDPAPADDPAPDPPGDDDGGGQPADEPQDPGQDPDPVETPTETEPAEPPPPALTPVNDAGGVGANARAYLRGDRPTLVLEIDTQSGVSLPDSAIQHVVSVLNRESNATVVLREGGATGAVRDSWSVDQLQAASDETRDTASNDSEVVMQVLVLRGGFELDGVLGVAFDASTVAVFPEQWSGFANLLFSDTIVARAVTLHEAGHLLGLVGLAEEPTSDHEDPGHPGHTSDEDDVMYFAIETDAIAQITGTLPTDFGPFTRADLAALREG